MSLQDKFIESQDKLIAKLNRDLEGHKAQKRLDDLKINALEKDVKTLENDRLEDIITITRQNAWLDAAHELIKSLEDQVSQMRAEKMVKEIINS